MYNIYFYMLYPTLLLVLMSTMQAILRTRKRKTHHLLVDVGLVGGVHADQLWADDVVDVSGSKKMN